jgi:hypothetical protein
MREALAHRHRVSAARLYTLRVARWSTLPPRLERVRRVGHTKWRPDRKRPRLIVQTSKLSLSESGPAQTANFCIYVCQFPAQPLEFTEFSNFPLRFVSFRHRFKAFRMCLTFRLVGQPYIRTMAGIARLRAAATGLAASPDDGTDRSGTEVAQIRNLLAQLGSLPFQVAQLINSHNTLSVSATLSILQLSSRCPERTVYVQGDFFIS